MRDAILTCAQKPTRVSLIYRTIHEMEPVLFSVNFSLALIIVSNVKKV